MNDPSVALVSGGSSGIGLSCAEALSRAGWRVFTLSRRGGGGAGCTPLTGDVTDPAVCEAAVARVLEEAGRLDLLVNCAGFGISGAAEFTPMEEARRQLEVNLLGTANLCRAALAHFRERRGPTHLPPPAQGRGDAHQILHPPRTGLLPQARTGRKA